MNYRKAIIEILCQINDDEVLMKILAVAKTHLEILQEKGGCAGNK